MTAGAVRAVLCDLDGVLRLWDPMTDLDHAHGLPPGTLAAAAFRPERLAPAVTGAVTDEQWRAAVTRDLAGVCGSPGRAAALVSAWTALTGRVDRDVLGLLAEARRRVPVVLVSNATTRLEDDLAALGLVDAVDAVVNTARVGVAKPDPAVFRIAADRAGVPARSCLVVDDTAGHVAAARAAGLQGLHYRGADGLRGALAPLLDGTPAGPGGGEPD